jgi:hypothetical protein
MDDVLAKLQQKMTLKLCQHLRGYKKIANQKLNGT